MNLYKTTAKDLPISKLSVTERVFAGLTDRLDDVVLIDGVDSRKFTAKNFIDQVKRLAGGLLEAGHIKGKTVALMAPNSPEYCIIFHAVAWAGGTITTLNPTYTSSEIHHQLKDSNADFLITIPETLNIAQNGAASLNNVEICVIGEAVGAHSLSQFFWESFGITSTR